MLVFFMPFVFYFIALSKNVSKTEKDHKRDMTYEINPFTGMKMPLDDNEKNNDKDNEKDRTDNKKA